MWLMIVPAGTKHSPDVGTVLAHSLRRWIGVVPVLGVHISCFVMMKIGAIARKQNLKRRKVTHRHNGINKMK